MVFSEIYYNKFGLFNYRTNMNAAYVKDGIINALPVTSLSTWPKRFFTFEQNADLLVVNAKIKTLFTQIKEKKGEVYDSFCKEIKEKGASALWCLRYNLNALNDKFIKGNDLNPFSRFVLRIINFVRSIFFKEKIVLQQYYIMDKYPNATLENFEKEIFNLNEQEKKEAENLFRSFKYSTIHTCMYVSSGYPSQNLSGEVFFKLKKGYLANFTFDFASMTFEITYDRETKHFYLQIIHSAKEPQVDSSFESGYRKPYKGFHEIEIGIRKGDQTTKETLRIEWNESFASRSRKLQLDPKAGISIPGDRDDPSLRFIIEPTPQQLKPVPQRPTKQFTPKTRAEIFHEIEFAYSDNEKPFNDWLKGEGVGVQRV